MTSFFRLAHLSDLHFSHIEKGIKQFFSKRWIGNFNVLLRRKKDFDHALLDLLPELLQKERVDLVLLSGDLTCTSSKQEFLMAQAFVEKLKQKNLQVVVIPGNHDHYTKKACRERTFYHYFPLEENAVWDLRKDRIAMRHLCGKWWLLLLDTTFATALFSAYGKFSEKMASCLEEAISSLPEDSQIILANHFPIDPSCHKMALKGRDLLLSILKKYPHVKCYLHGHNHKNTIMDLRSQGLPIAVDSGSVASRSMGGWMLMDLEEKGCQIRPFTWESSSFSWRPGKPNHFTW